MVKNDRMEDYGQRDRPQWQWCPFLRQEEGRRERAAGLSRRKADKRQGEGPDKIEVKDRDDLVRVLHDAMGYRRAT
jgi:hypothetical protein